LRFTRDEAVKQATELATAFVHARSDLPPLRWFGTRPAMEQPKREASKHPVVWNVMFALIPQAGETIDGGEVVIVVDLEKRSVRLGPEE
jgi:hypothetical protein